MNETTSALTVILAIVTIVGNAVSAIISRLTAQDKMKYDTKLALLESQHARCIEDHKDSQAEIVQNKQEIRQLNERIDSLTGIHPVLPPGTKGVGVFEVPK